MDSKFTAFASVQGFANWADKHDWRLIATARDKKGITDELFLTPSGNKISLHYQKGKAFFNNDMGWEGISLETD